MVDKQSISILCDLVVKEADREDRRWLHKVVDLFFLDLGCLQSQTLCHREGADNLRVFFHITDFVIRMLVFPGEDVVGGLAEEEQRSV